MARKRGKIDFFKKTKVKKEIITKFINLYNSYVDSKGYEYTTLKYNVEFEDTKLPENINETYTWLSPNTNIKTLKTLKTDPDYESLREIHNKILLSAVDFKDELENHSMTVIDFEFLNDLNERMKEDKIQKSIDDMERNMALDDSNIGD